MKIINFGPQAKTNLLAWDTEEDFVKFLRNCNDLYNRGTPPYYYLVVDPEAPKHTVGKIEHFLTEMKRTKTDLDTIKRNIEANRFPDLTGGKYEQPDGVN
jgi:hypothetical protein